MRGRGRALWCVPAAWFTPSPLGLPHARPQAILPSWKGKVGLVKIDTEKNPDVASAYNIHKLPTLILFR